jgi:hypothetical protein
VGGWLRGQFGGRGHNMMRVSELISVRQAIEIAKMYENNECWDFWEFLRGRLRWKQ